MTQKTLDEAMRRAAQAAGSAMQIPTIGRLSSHWERKGEIARDAVIASLAADGFVLVPREATQEMKRYIYGSTGTWADVLAAAPKPGDKS